MLESLMRKLGYVKADPEVKDPVIFDLGSDVGGIYLLFSGKSRSRVMGSFKKGAALPQPGEWVREKNQQGEFHYQITKLIPSEGPSVPGHQDLFRFFLDVEGPL